LSFRTARAALNWASERMALVGSIHSVNPDKLPSGNIRPRDHTPAFIIAFSIMEIYEKCEWNGYIKSLYLDGMNWFNIPEEDMRQVRSIIRRFSRQLREDGILRKRIA